MVHPTIRGKNLYRSHLRRAQSLAHEWSRRYPVVEAVMLTGGVARGYADEGSELDLTVFLTPGAYRAWVQNCESRLPEGDQLVDGTWVDLRLWSIDVERRRPWHPLRAWDASRDFRRGTSRRSAPGSKCALSRPRTSVEGPGRAWALMAWWKETFPDAWEASATREAIRALRSGPMAFAEFEHRFGSRRILAFPLRAVARVRREERRRLVRLEETDLRRAVDKGVPAMLPYQQDRLRLAVESLERRR